MFFDAADISEFNQWRLELDNAGRRGDLDPAFTMFNRYHEKLRQRIQATIATLPDTLSGFDYEQDEYMVIDYSTMPWAPDAQELDERWRKRLKNQALSLILADKPMRTFRKPWSDVTESAESARSIQRPRRFPDLREHAGRAVRSARNYFSPGAPNFDINMSLSFDIGAMLQVDDEYAKVSRLIPAGPADKQGDLRPLI